MFIQLLLLIYETNREWELLGRHHTRCREKSPSKAVTREKYTVQLERCTNKPVTFTQGSSPPAHSARYCWADPEQYSFHHLVLILQKTEFVYNVYSVGFPCLPGHQTDLANFQNRFTSVPTISPTPKQILIQQLGCGAQESVLTLFPLDSDKQTGGTSGIVESVHTAFGVRRA